MLVRSVPAQTRWELRHSGILYPRCASQSAKLCRLEPKPGISLLPHRLVVMPCIVDDDERPSRSTQRCKLRHDFRWLRSVMQNAGSEHCIRPLAYGHPQLLCVEFPFDERHVAEGAMQYALACLQQASASAIHPDHPLVYGCQKLQQSTITPVPASRASERRGRRGASAARYAPISAGMP